MDAAVVWEDAAPEATPPILQTWASARGLRLVAPREGGEHAITVDAGLATRVEEELHAARELTTQHDADGAERALARAEAILRAHPEMPQGAWLLAEVERGWASRFARLDPTDVARAARHWRAAAALDGGRAAGVGEPGTEAEAPVAFSIGVAGATSNVELRWDGDSIAPGPHEARPGAHQLVAKSSGRVVFAQWIAIARNAVVHVALPTPEPCSRADLTSSSATCASWVAIRRGEHAGTFVVRSCAGSACGAELLVAPMSSVDRTPPIVRHDLPVWARWTLVGLGVVAVGAAAGVIGWLASPEQQQAVFKTGGKPQ